MAFESILILANKNLVFKDSEETVLNVCFKINNAPSIDLANSILVLKLYKQVFQPQIGNSLGFIGFAQPSSGGV